jgi:hypothetical protein
MRQMPHERDDARRVEPHLLPLKRAGVDGEEFRLSEPRIGRIEPLRPAFAQLVARQHLDVGQPAYLHAFRSNRL